MITNDQERLQVTFSELEDSVLEVMNQCLRHHTEENREIKVDDSMEIEEDEIFGRKSETNTEKVEVLEELLRKKDSVIREYEDKIRILENKL